MAPIRVAEWSPARPSSDGSPSMSPNPFADHHLIYAVALIAPAAAAAGDTLGGGASGRAVLRPRPEPVALNTDGAVGPSTGPPRRVVPWAVRPRSGTAGPAR